MSKLKATTKKSKLFDKIYDFVKKIPEGKVATYGQIAEVLGTRDARKVGWALHANRDENVPCHRVVNKEGKLAENFAFNGWKEQRNRLASEGVVFKNKKHVDLTKCLTNFS